MQTMDDSGRDELSRLRARAYGPDADIGGDPDALARLRDLEADARGADRPPVPVAGEDLGRRRAESPAGVVAESPQGAPARVISEGEDVAPAAADLGDGSTAGSASPRLSRGSSPLRGRRGLLIGWVVSLLVVGGLGYGLGAGRTPSDVPGAREVARLTDEVPNPLGDQGLFAGMEDTAFYEYAGLVVVTIGRGGVLSDARCVAIAQAQTGGSGDQQNFGACATEPFRPTMSTRVTPTSPAELRAEFPAGTALQFIWGGDGVTVFAADPPASTDAPA